MDKIRVATLSDISFLEKYDLHISKDILKISITHERIYIMEKENQIIGWCRYNLFWDNTPFLNMLFVLEPYRYHGYGTALLKHFEQEMLLQGYFEVMTSTLVHEDAIHFYLKENYQVVGGFHPTSCEYEIILKKKIR